jgi:hypothetical protein
MGALVRRYHQKAYLRFGALWRLQHVIIAALKK